MKFKGFIMLQQINLCRFQAGLIQLWPPKLGKAHGNIYNCQEETSVAVLQDHVTGEVFNTRSRNIRSFKRFAVLYGID